MTDREGIPAAGYSREPESTGVDGKLPGVIPLPGGNLTCKVFWIGDRIVRCIRPGYESYYRYVLELCDRHDLYRHGITRTWIANDIFLPGTECTLFLEHKRIPFITYAHEWPPSMFRDAALFHIELNQFLQREGLLLLDMHPYNILFDGVRPVYVDFPKIARIEDLKLFNRDRHKNRFPGKKIRNMYVFWWMDPIFVRDFIPMFFRPLLLMDAGKHPQYRSFIRNFSDRGRHPVMTWKECARILPRSIVSSVSATIMQASVAAGKEQFWHVLHRSVTRLDVSPGPAAEDLPFIPPTLGEVIRQGSPSTLLDIGNRGAISLVAARKGCTAVAIDPDERSMDALYRMAREADLRITPLVIDPATIFSGAEYEEPSSLLLPPHRRFRADLVVCGPEAVTRIMGAGVNREQVAQVFNRLTTRDLLITIPESAGTSAAMPGLEQALAPYFTAIMRQETTDTGYTILWCRKMAPG
jgi:hypothetical protein